MTPLHGGLAANGAVIFGSGNGDITVNGSDLSINNSPVTGGNGGNGGNGGGNGAGGSGHGGNGGAAYGHNLSKGLTINENRGLVQLGSITGGAGGDGVGGTGGDGGDGGNGGTGSNGVVITGSGNVTVTTPI